MFKGLTKDLAGTADICSAVVDASALAAATYILPHETILFAFQSAKEEFAFTNEALVTVRGENATTTRKLVERFDYREHAIADVAFETTGRIDRDCEIKFRIGETAISIDIARKEEDAVKIYYKALVALAREQEHRRRSWQFCKDGLANATAAMKVRGQRTPAGDGSTLTEEATSVMTWIQADFDRVNPRDYRDTIESVLKK